MIVVGSFLAIVALAGVHSTVGRWRWLQTRDHSPWLSLSAGTALAYVFVYLLPKLAVTQQKLSALLSQGDWVPILRNQAYLIALLGLVCFFWLGSIDERLTDTRGVDKSALNGKTGSNREYS